MINQKSLLTYNSMLEIKFILKYNILEYNLYTLSFLRSRLFDNNFNNISFQSIQFLKYFKWAFCY